MKHILISLLILLTFTPYAICNNDTPVHLNAGDKAPFDGYEIDQAKVLKIRNLSIDNDMNAHINQDLTQENTLLNQRLTNAQQQNESLSRQLVETKDSGFFSKVGFFILGAGITGLVSYGIYKSR